MSQNRQPESHPKEDYSNLWRNLTILLSLGGSTALTVLLTFFTFFAAIAAQLRYLPAIPLFAETLNYIRGIYKVITKPMSLGWKLFIGTALTFMFSAMATAFSSSMLVYASTIFMKVAVYSPVLFFGAFSIGTALTFLGFVQAAYEYKTQPWTRTEQSKLRLANKAAKTVLMGSMLTVLIPLLLAVGAGGILVGLLANPFTGGPTAAALFTVIVVAAVSLTVLKIVKTQIKHRMQERAAKAMLSEGDPYTTLDINRDQFNLRSKKEKRIMIEQAYQNTISLALDDAEKAKIYRAYELLRYERSRDLYHVFQRIKDNQVPQNLEETLGIASRSGIWKYRPFSWLNYQYRQLKADPGQKQNLETAYRIISNSALYKYYGETARALHPAYNGGLPQAGGVPPGEGDSASQELVGAVRDGELHGPGIFGIFKPDLSHIQPTIEFEVTRHIQPTIEFEEFDSPKIVKN